MRCLLESCPHYEVSVRRGVRHMRCLLERCPPYEYLLERCLPLRCLLERCPPYELSVRELSAI